MPLTLERDGVFRASVYDKTNWYIVDPSAEGGVEPALQAFLQRVERTNRGEWQRVARATVFFAVLIMVGGGLAYVSTLVPGIDIWRGLIYVGALIVGLIAAGVSIIPVFPLRHPEPSEENTTRRIPPQIVEWADDSISAASLWSLVRAHHELDDVRRLARVVLDDWDFELGGERPDEAVHTLVVPTLRREFTERRNRYLQMSAELGFTPLDADQSDFTDLEKPRRI